MAYNLSPNDRYWQTPEGRLRDPHTGRLKSELRAEAAALAEAERPAMLARAEAHNAKFEAEQARKAQRARADWEARAAAIAEAEAKPWTPQERKRQDELLEDIRTHVNQATLARVSFRTQVRDLAKRLTDSKAALMRCEREFEKAQFEARALAGKLDVSRRVRIGAGERAQRSEMGSVGINADIVFLSLWRTKTPPGYRSVGRAIEAVAAALNEINLLLETESS